MGKLFTLCNTRDALKIAIDTPSGINSLDAKAEGIVDEIRKENGCIRYDYYYSEKDPNEILLIEEWESKEHQQIHIDQPHMARLREFKNDYIESTKLGEFEILN